MKKQNTIDVHSHNKLGITHKILSAFASLDIDVIALEMETHHTYIKYQNPEQSANNEKLKRFVLGINGVIKIDEIEVLPSEAKRLHLDALLSNLPDPIFDIDESGNILKVNHATKAILGIEETEIYTKNVTELFSEPLERLLNPINTSIELTCMDNNYYAEITPIIPPGNNPSAVKGAVIILKRPEKLGLTISTIQQNSFQGDTIIAQSPEMQDILARANRFSELELPILIIGETGTGKEILAKTIHENSSRKDSPFLAINCAALPENLLESELFGYSAGAFSGALKSGKPGLFELAHHGTLFLDEIGEMSPYLQAKILRFMQDYTFRRLGGSKERSVDVRIISATHRKLNTLFATNQFREDLYYRLNVLSLLLPPLRDREGDIELLGQHFAKLAGLQINRQDCQLSEDAIRRLKTYRWPGNIRQLQNVIFRSAAIGNKAILNAKDLLFNYSKDPSTNKNITTTGEVTSLKDAVASYEKKLLASMLKKYPSTRQLAKQLSVSHNTIAIKLRKYSLS